MEEPKSTRTYQTLHPLKWKTTPLSEFLQKQNPQSLEKGPGIRKWRLGCVGDTMSVSDEEIRRTIQKKYLHRLGEDGRGGRSRASFVSLGRSSTRGCEVAGSSSASGKRFLKGLDDCKTDDVKETKDVIAEEDSSMVKFVKDIMKDPNRQTVTIEGRPCSKKVLVEVLYKYCQTVNKGHHVEAATQTVVDSVRKTTGCCSLQNDRDKRTTDKATEAQMELVEKFF